MDNLKRYRGVRALVLGASGFIGRWVARELSQQGADVALLVRDRAAVEEIFSRFGIFGEPYELDLSDFSALKELLGEIRPQITFNLAGYGVDRSEREEQTAYRINAQLVTALCEGISKLNAGPWDGMQIVHTGTAMEFGAVGGDLSETTIPSPSTLYGKSKLAGTIALAQACQTLPVKGLTARLFTVYGPGEGQGRLLPSLLQAARTGERLDLTAGEQYRDFTFVEDVAEGLLRLGLVRARPGEAVNLATGKLTPVRDFVKQAAGVLDISPDRLNFGGLPVRPEEMHHDPVSLTRLLSLTVWKPCTRIVEGVAKTMTFEYGWN